MTAQPNGKRRFRFPGVRVAKGQRAISESRRQRNYEQIEREHREGKHLLTGAAIEILRREDATFDDDEPKRDDDALL